MQVEYSAVKQLLQMSCHNCHDKKVIDPQVEAEVRSIEGWLKVQKSSGETYAYCSLPCLQKGSHNLKPKSSIELVEG